MGRFREWKGFGKGMERKRAREGLSQLWSWRAGGWHVVLHCQVVDGWRC